MIHVLARNPETAQMAVSVGGEVTHLGGSGCVADADLVVNATPIGMSGGPAADDLPVDVEEIPSDAVIVDIVYDPLETPFLRAGRRRSLRTVDGLAMLAGQAASQFTAWTEIDAPLAVMMAAARSGTAEENPSIP